MRQTEMAAYLTVQVKLMGGTAQEETKPKMITVLRNAMMALSHQENSVMIEMI